MIPKRVASPWRCGWCSAHSRGPFPRAFGGGFKMRPRCLSLASDADLKAFLSWQPTEVAQILQEEQGRSEPTTPHPQASGGFCSAATGAQFEQRELLHQGRAIGVAVSLRQITAV